MQTLLDFFAGIGNAITAAFDFVISFFQDLIYMIKLLGKVVLNIPNYFTWLPAPALALLVLIISLVVVYKVLGREG